MSPQIPHRRGRTIAVCASMVELSCLSASAAVQVNGIAAVKAALVAAAPPASNSAEMQSAAGHSSLLEGLRRSPKHLPCSYLYDTAGSDLYEEITELEEYYPFKAEQVLLTENAQDIIRHIPSGCVLVELGCGSAAKTSILLNALLQRDSPAGVRFAGIDVSSSALAMAKTSLLESCPGLRSKSIDLVCAEYTEGVQECRRRFPTDRLVLLWLGSSVGNFSHSQAVSFFVDVLAAGGSNMQIFLCTDLWKDTETLRAAYHDSKGVTEAFIKNGIQHAMCTLGFPEAGHPSKWDYEVVVNSQEQQVEMWLVCKVNTGCLAPGISCTAGERVLVEVSRKFTPTGLQGLAYKSGLFIQASWHSRLYSTQMLLSPLDALERCWADTDKFFDSLPNWWTEPISVRRPYGFYYGHIAAFAKLKVLPGAAEEPFDQLLSRGIDPDLVDPSICHAHPEVPPQWPSKAELLVYVAGVRALLRTAITAGVGSAEEAGPAGISMRLICFAVEHERMHQETLVYMRIQEVKATYISRPEAPGTPPGSPIDGNRDVSVPLELIKIPGGLVQLGIPTDGSVGFGWDNEGPPAAPVRVSSFSAAAKPVTIAEFYRFAIEEQSYSKAELWEPEDWTVLRSTGQVMPASWSQSASNGVTVHFVVPEEASLPWQSVADTAVACSLAEAEAFCKWAGGGARIMSEAEWQRIADCSAGDRVDLLSNGGWELTSTPFMPFEGFQAMSEYSEYSTDFFDGKHYVLRGASAATAPSMHRQPFRNYYQRQYPYVLARFHCCYDA